MIKGSDLIEFRVLGPVQAVCDGVSLRLGGRRQHALLALLLVERGRPVSTDRLADELWAGRPPRRARVTVPTYVSRLRAALGDAIEIPATGGGYALLVEPDQVDALLFERLVREGQASLGRRLPNQAATKLVAALSLWRGPAFGDLGGQGALEFEAQRLDELRLYAIEIRIEANLALGAAGELVDELETLTREHPYRERFWRQLMLALYRADRQADALAMYRRARRLLDEELGIEPSEQLERLQVAILRHEVPPPTPPEARHNLPAAISSFVGRARSLEEVVGLLERTRLVTLTGVAGVGKTRLALEVARRAVADTPDGVFFVDLAPLTDPDLIASQIAASLDLRDQSGLDAIRLLESHARDLESLIVVDNCEHVRDGAALTAARLLAAAPRLRILATSRERLGVPGEIDYRVQPLGVPSRLDDVNEIRGSEAVSFFLTRARAARVDLPDDAPTLDAAARICIKLDGLPLAMELAAARAKALSLADITRRLGDRFRFLDSPRRQAPARHRTLRAAIDWSYELLAAEERALLARLSVFAGDFSLEAVAAIAQIGDRAAAFDGLERLVDASLVVATDTDAGMRYRLLETIRQYAAVRLDESGEAAAIRDHHAALFLQIAEQAWAPTRFGGGEAAAQLAADHENLRAALEWTRHTGSAEQHLRLAEALAGFWQITGNLDEGRRWLESAIELANAVDPALRGRGLQAAASLAWAHGDLDRALQLATEAQAIFSTLEFVNVPTGPAQAIRFEGMAWNTLGLVALARGEHDRAKRDLESARRCFEALDEETPWRAERLAGVTRVLAAVDLDAGDLDGARSLMMQARTIEAASRLPIPEAHGDILLSLIALDRGQLGEAAALLADALEGFRELGNVMFTLESMDVVAAIAQACGDVRIAAHYLSAASRLRERTGFRPFARLGRIRERMLVELPEILGELAFKSAWEEGLAVSENEAIDEALTFLRSKSGSPDRQISRGKGAEHGRLSRVS